VRGKWTLSQQLMTHPGRQQIPDWREAARCRTADPDLFFHPEGERAKARYVRLRRARQVCTQCPVMRECAAFAVASREGFGIWGGMSEDERVTVIVAAGERPRGRSIHAARLGVDVREAAMRTSRADLPHVG
jgi:WhiB family redox-sensing transcriptional regulator